MIQHFLDYIAIEKKYSVRTVREYGDDLRAFCTYRKWSQEEFNPAEVCEADIREWMMDMMDRGQSPKSVKRRLAAMRSFYKYMLRVGLIEKDITRRIVSPKIEKPLPVFFKESEMQHATEWDSAADDFESILNCLIIELLYQTGMRQAELLGLEDKDIDTQQGQVRIFGKRKKERVVPIGEKLCQQIEQYRQARGEGYSTFFVHENRNGERVPLSKSTLYNIVRTRMGEVSTLKKHSPHVLRHTFATTMLNNGADIRTIQTLMGHASLAATQVYTHTTFEQIRQAYDNAHPRGKKGTQKRD